MHSAPVVCTAVWHLFTTLLQLRSLTSRLACSRVLGRQKKICRQDFVKSDNQHPLPKFNHKSRPRRPIIFFLSFFENEEDSICFFKTAIKKKYRYRSLMKRKRINGGYCARTFFNVTRHRIRQLNRLEKKLRKLVYVLNTARWIRRVRWATNLSPNTILAYLKRWSNALPSTSWITILDSAFARAKGPSSIALNTGLLRSMDRCPGNLQVSGSVPTRNTTSLPASLSNKESHLRPRKKKKVLASGFEKNSDTCDANIFVPWESDTVSQTTKDVYEKAFDIVTSMMERWKNSVVLFSNPKMEFEGTEYKIRS